jgi:hypothetical protein
MFYSAFVRKCTDMCEHRSGVQLLERKKVVAESTVMQQHRLYNVAGRISSYREFKEPEMEFLNNIL